MRPNPQETANLVTFAEEILNGKLHFLCSANNSVYLGFFTIFCQVSHKQDFKSQQI